VDHLHATVYVNAEDDDWFQVLTVNDDGTVTARQNTTGQLSQPERTFNAAHATGTTTTPFGALTPANASFKLTHYRTGQKNGSS